MTTLAQESSYGVVYGLCCTCHPCLGVRYVGITTRGLGTRLLAHQKSHMTPSRLHLPVYVWMKKHGAQNVFSVLLQECEDRDSLSAAEVDWIAKLRSFGYLLMNVSDGGYGYFGTNRPTEKKKRAPLTDEQRIRLSQSVTAAWQRPEVREKNLAGRALAASLPRNSSRMEKLTDSDVLEIRALKAAGLMDREIGELFGISGKYAGNVARGVKKKNVSPTLATPPVPPRPVEL